MKNKRLKQWMAMLLAGACALQVPNAFSIQAASDGGSVAQNRENTRVGDVNGDGKADSADVNAICDHIRGTAELTGSALASADVNGDGKVDSRDSNRVCDHIRGTYLLWEDESASKPGEYTAKIDPATGKAYDLGGMEVIIRDWWTYDDPNYEPTTAYEEAQKEYIEWAEKTYNFTLKRTAMSDWGSTPNDYVNYVMNAEMTDYDEDGKNDYYIFTLYQSAECMAAMKAGLMYDVTKLDCLDLTDPKWDTSIFEISKSPKGAYYSFRAERHEPRMGCYFNKRLLAEAGIDPEAIYQWQADGTWTWDKFEECLKKCTRDTDGDGVNDTWGMVCFGSRFYPAAVTSNNADFIGRENGNFLYKVDSNETLAALTWGFNMMNNYNRPAKDGEDWSYFTPTFVNGEAAFFPGEEVYVAGTLKNGNGREENEEGYEAPMADEFGFVCFPKGPSASTYTDYNGDNLFVIPSFYSAEEAWKVAFVYDIYTDPVPGYADYNPAVSSLMNSFDDTKSVVETMPYLWANNRPRYNYFVSGIDMGSDLLWTFNEENTPATQAEAIRDKWMELINAMNEGAWAE